MEQMSTKELMYAFQLAFMNKSCIYILQKDWNALHVACSVNRVRIANFLMKTGKADPNAFYSDKVCSNQDFVHSWEFV